MKRQVVSILVALVLIASVVTPTWAKKGEQHSFTTNNPELNESINNGEVTVRLYREPDTATKKRIDAHLKDLGYSSLEVTNTSWPVKENISKHGLRAERATRASMPQKPVEGETGPMALNPTWMDWVTWGENEVVGTQNQITLHAVYDWKQMPTWYFTDKIGYVWASDLGLTWAYQSIVVDAYAYACNWTLGCEWVMSTSTTPVDSEPNVGHGAAVDIASVWYIDGVQYQTVDMDGVSSTVITRPKGTGTQPLQVAALADYFHKQATCGFTLTYNKNGPGINVSCSTVHDRTNSGSFGVQFYQ